MGKELDDLLSNIVILKLSRYNELLQAEKVQLENTIYISYGWGGRTVKTNDEAIKQMAEDHQNVVKSCEAKDKIISELEKRKPEVIKEDFSKLSFKQKFCILFNLKV